jgi:hypothetical protein
LPQISEKETIEMTDKNKSNGNSNQSPSGEYTRQIYFLIVYYLFVLAFAFWLLFDTWSSNFVLVQAIGVSGKTLEDPLLRTILFIIVGGIMGNVLYLVRQLYNHYAKLKDYDPRWFGKYITGPWEGAGMAMVVLALIRGGVAVFGGSTGTDVTAVSNFAAFGTAALVGFGMRQVVGWLEGLVRTMFIDTEQGTAPADEEKESGQDDKKKQ